jgi:hypothetical protein
VTLHCKTFFFILIMTIFSGASAQIHAASDTHEIQTNAVHMSNAPKWLKRTRVEKIIDHIQMVLEWNIRRIEVTWYSDLASFDKAHTLGPLAMAVSRRSDGTMHLGPRVTTSNFDQVFGHELVHIISAQKYKDAIPRWLEEGLANHLAKNGNVDYKWLASKPFPAEVRNLTHPFASSMSTVHYHYVASQALAEMIAKKCDLSNVLRLSVGTNMDIYLDTYCEIKDLNESFRKWVKTKASMKPKS